MKTIYKLLLIISLTAINKGQVLFNSNNTTYSTNFDFFANTGSTKFWPTSGEGLNWVGSVTQYYVSDGTHNSASAYIYSFGTIGETDRALGLRKPSTTSRSFALKFRNSDEFQTVNYLRISFRGEQWREENNSSNLKVFIDKTTSISSQNFSELPGLKFTSIKNTQAAALNGNIEENQLNLVLTFPYSILPGENVMIKWENDGISGLGIDDFQLEVFYGFVTPPAISPDLTLNTVDNDIELTFTDDLYWRENITSVEINNQSLSPGDYTLSAGKITLHPSNGNDSLKAACIKNIVVKATGFNDASVSQEILPGAASVSNSTVTVSPAFGQGVTSVVTITANDRFNNRVAGYVFKAAGIMTNNNSNVTEEYTIHTQEGLTGSTTDISLTATNSAGSVSFNVVLPSFINSGDGISIVTKLNNGTPLENGTLSYIKPAQIITTTGFDPGTNEIGQGSSKNIIYRLRCDITNDTVGLSSITLPLTGTYTSSDIKASGLRLWHSEDMSLDDTDNQIASATSGASGTGENLTFTGISQRLRLGRSYLILTADISEMATTGRSIIFNSTPGAAFTYSNTGVVNNVTYGAPKSHIISGPTTLTAGDIAIIEFKTPSAGVPNERLFTFIPLVKINGGTKIQFTNKGWRSSGAFRTGESVCEWTAPAQGLLPGEAVSIWAINTNLTGTTKGSVTGDLSTFNNIDQIFAFTGSVSSPNLITGISIGNSSWQSDGINATTSSLPPVLTNGTNAQFFPKSFGKLTKSSAGERFVFQQSLFNKANWRLENDRFTDNTYHYKEEIKEVETGSNVVLPSTAAAGIKSIEFEMVSKQGELKVMAFNSGAENPAGVVGDVSSFRFVIENQGVEFNNCTLRFNLSDLPNIVINEGAADIKLYKRENVGTGSFNAIGLMTYMDNGTPGDQTDDWLEISGITSFSEFVFGSEGGNLPVELTSFSGEVRGDKVRLKWHTEMELSNSGFEIQRRADNNSEWVKTGFVNGNGTTYIPQDYSWEEKALTGTSRLFYRLKQIDTDGTFDYSEEIAVDIVISDYALYQNYPNPFNPATLIKFALPSESKVRLEVYNTVGELVNVLKDENMKAGYHEISFDAGELVSGVYILKLHAGSRIMTKKMMLMR